MASFLARIFGWPGGGRGNEAAPSRASAPARGAPARTPAGPQYRSDFAYSDTATWTFPHQAVASSNLASVAYDFDEQLLEIRFVEASRNHGATYRYSGVPLAVFRGLLDAPSKGRYHWRFIRDRYVYVDMG